MADGSPQQFSSWDQVAAQYGSAVSDQLQAQNVPLSQVGQLAQQFGSALGQNVGSQTASGGTFGGGFMGASGGSNQPPPPAPTTSTSILTDPQYNLQRIGAAATGQQMVVNPNPSQQPISAKSGIYSGPQNPIISASTPQAPTGPQTQVPGLLGGAAQVPRPTRLTPNFMTGTQQPGGTNFQQGRPFAGVPSVQPPAAPMANVNTTPVQTPYGPSTPGINIPPPPPSFSSIAGGGGGVIGGAIPPVSAGSPPIGSLGKPMQSGGSVSGRDTDTVPAMLTPGEYVINQQAAQKLGKDKLDQINRAGKKSGLGSGLGMLGMQGGGEVPNITGAAQNYAFQQLTPEEQLLLQQQQAGGNALSPQAMQLQKKLSGLISQYVNANPSSGAGPAPNANVVAGGMFGGGFKPQAPGPEQPAQTQTPAATPSPQATAMQVGPPTPTAQQQAALAAQPPPPAPANQPTSAQLTDLTNSPAGQSANMTPTQKGEMGVAGGIASIGQAWAKAAQDIASENWKPIQAGSWANPSQYDNAENEYYQRYHQQMQQMII